METINKVPKLVLIVDHSSAGSNKRFHAVYHACVESIEHLTDVAIQLRTKLTESTQENALIKPLIEHHRAHHAEIPLHINALSAELDNNLHAHFSRARWQSSWSQTFTALLRVAGPTEGTQGPDGIRQTRIYCRGPRGKPPLEVPESHDLRNTCPATRVTVSNHWRRWRKPKEHQRGKHTKVRRVRDLDPGLERAG